LFVTECRVLVCDFHREQAWERWVKKTENKVGEDRAVVLALLRAVAKAESATHGSLIRNFRNTLKTIG